MKFQHVAQKCLRSLPLPSLLSLLFLSSPSSILVSIILLQFVLISIKHTHTLIPPHFVIYFLSFKFGPFPHLSSILFLLLLLLIFQPQISEPGSEDSLTMERTAFVVLQTAEHFQCSLSGREETEKSTTLVNSQFPGIKLQTNS